MKEHTIEVVVPVVHDEVIALDDRLIARVRKHVQTSIDEGWIGGHVSDGPIVTFGPDSLFAHDGSIDQHVDGAGYTYGLVIIADGDHVLEVAGSRMPLKSGSVFLIDSDRDHGTVGDGGVIVFVTRDFHHDGSRIPLLTEYMRRGLELIAPTVGPEQFARDAVAGLIDWLGPEGGDLGSGNVTGEV